MSHHAADPTAEALLAHESFVRAVVRGVLRDEHAMQDVLQETWLRALGGAPRGERALRAWLASVARNAARSLHRREARRERRERAVAREEAVEPVERAAERLGLRRAVADAVLALDEPYRSVVLLRYEERLKPAQIGARLGRSPATVRSELSRAHALLRERLDGRFDGETRAWAAPLLALSTAAPALGAPILVPLLAVGAVIAASSLALRRAPVMATSTNSTIEPMLTQGALAPSASPAPGAGEAGAGAPRGAAVLELGYVSLPDDEPDRPQEEPPRSPLRGMSYIGE